MVLNNLGRDHSDLGEAQQAYDLDLQALAIWREVKDQRDEAQDLMTIAWAYSLMKQPDLSFTSAIAALGLAKATGDPANRRQHRELHHARLPQAESP